MASTPIVVISSDSDDDVWGHRPLKRIKTTQESQSEKTLSQVSSSRARRSVPVRRGNPRLGDARALGQSFAGTTSTTQTQSQRPRRRRQSGASKCKTKSKTAVNTEHEICDNQQYSDEQCQELCDISKSKKEEICPICQAPFSAIHLNSPEGHIQECLEFERPDTECPAGLVCDSTILTHFQKFSHNLLALVRSEGQSDGSQSPFPSSSRSYATSSPLNIVKKELGGWTHSDSDFEIPSTAKKINLTPSKCKEPDYDYKIIGDRVLCTPKQSSSASVSPSASFESCISESQSKPKNTARKSCKTAIPRKSDINGNEMPSAFKREGEEEKTKSSSKHNLSRTSPFSDTANSKKETDSLMQTPASQNQRVRKSEKFSGKDSKRKSSLEEGKSPSRSLLHYFSPKSTSSKTRNEKQEADLEDLDDDQSEECSHSQDVESVESDVDIFAEYSDNDPVSMNSCDPPTKTNAEFFEEKDNIHNNCSKNQTKLTADNESPDRFTKIRNIIGRHNTLENSTTKERDSPNFDLLHGLEDSDSNDSESLFFSPNSETSNVRKSEEENVTVNPIKRMDNSIPLPPNLELNDLSDDELPEISLTSYTKEEDKGNKCGGKEMEPTRSGTLHSKPLAADVRFGDPSENEDSQSLFFIPGRGTGTEMGAGTSDEGQGSHGADVVHSDNDVDEGIEGEVEEVDHADDLESRNSKSIYSQPMITQPGGNMDNFPTANTSCKQGTLDSFLGCKPLAKKTKPPAVPQQKGQWTGGSRQTKTKNGGEQQGRKEWKNSSGRQCPFYKRMPGTSLTVDAFKFGVIPGCRAYFLSHFHYDHYGGLSKHFDQQLYCSKVTGNLVISRIKVDACYVKCLPMNQPCVVDDVEVTLLDANHCPGSVLFLFKLKSGATYLHTGDFRADVKMEQYPELIGCHVNQLYLDTTYCDPSYKFPPQSEVIDFAVQTALRAVKHNSNTLIVCGTYTIGKEKVFRAIAEALSCQVYVTAEKMRILQCLEDGELQSLLTRDVKKTRLHVVNMAIFNHPKLKDYLSDFSPRYNAILAFKPTGWTHSSKAVSVWDIKPSKSGVSTMYGIPYSEHSSYSEMKRFVQFVGADKILPTVNNGSAKARKAMDDIFRQWTTEEARGQSSSQNKTRSMIISNWFKK